MSCVIWWDFAGNTHHQEFNTQDEAMGYELGLINAGYRTSGVLGLEVVEPLPC